MIIRLIHFKRGVAMKRREKAEQARDAKQKELIKLAEQFGGKLTLTEAVMGSSLSKKDAETLLDDMVRKGTHCNFSHVTRCQGLVVFRAWWLPVKGVPMPAYF